MKDQLDADAVIAIAVGCSLNHARAILAALNDSGWSVVKLDEETGPRPEDDPGYRIIGGTPVPIV